VFVPSIAIDIGVSPATTGVAVTTDPGELPVVALFGVNSTASVLPFTAVRAS
jgi:hypothetical protein